MLHDPSPPWPSGPGFSLMTFVKQHKLGLVLHAPFDVVLPGVATPVQPDLLFVRQARIADIVTPKMIVGAPDLVVEISSPGRRPDRLTSRR
ncbi:MAG: Uma2 family endonuclease [Anaerolineae bacterium]|nr:Uma2 family endonuclease [Anaerolineae bacterium]